MWPPWPHGLLRAPGLAVHGRSLLVAFVVLFAICDASAPTNWASSAIFWRKTFSRLQGYIQFANFLACCAPRVSGVVV